MFGPPPQRPADRAKRIGCRILVFLLLLLPASAQARSGRAEERSPAAGAAVAVAAPRHGPTDPHELEAFLDPLFAQAMADAHVPGAVFLVVKDGQVFFSKGYGYADLTTRTPVGAGPTRVGWGLSGQVVGGGGPGGRGVRKGLPEPVLDATGPGLPTRETGPGRRGCARGLGQSRWRDA